MLLAAGLTGSDLILLRQFWQKLPGVLRVRLTAEKYEEAARQVRGQSPRQARQGLVAAHVSSLFTAAMREPLSAQQQQDLVQRLVSDLRDTRLGRLQVAALRMLELEHAGTPVHQWWPEIRAFLEGTERGPLNHYLGELITAQAQVFERLGWGSGAALMEAQQPLEGVHGPLLQFLTERLYRVADAAENSEAAACRQLANRLLRDWILEPGPLSLRLLAAELLATRLTGQDNAGNGRTAATLARHLREWRAAWLRQQAARIVPVPPLSIQRSPEHCPQQYEHLLRWAFATLCAVGATAAAAVTSTVGLVLGRGSHTHRRGETRATLRVAVHVTVALIAAGSAGLSLGRNAAEEIARLGPWGPCWPRAPLVVAGATAAALLGPAGWPLRRAAITERFGHLRSTAVWSWLLLAVALLCATRGTRTALVRYDDCVAAAVRNAAPPAELSDLLRRWDPDTGNSNDENHH